MLCVLKEMCGPVRFRCSELTAPPKVREHDLSGTALQLKMKIKVFLQSWKIVGQLLGSF